MQIKLSIVTPTQDVLEVECDEVVVPGTEGELGFLPGHLPLVTALRPGVLTVALSNRRRFFAVGSGFAEVEDNVVSVLAESCEEGPNINRARAEKALKDAEHALSSLSPDDGGYHAQWARAARAQARLDAFDRKA